MEITYYGANCFRITTKETSLVFDDNLNTLRGKSIIKDNDVALYTQLRLKDNEATPRLFIDAPGEYELSDITVFGIQASAYADTDKEKSSTIYRCLYQGMQIVILGHVSENLDEEQLEQIGVVDVLILPVGGRGYTLDAEAAAKLIKLIAPKITVPSHYSDLSLKYEVDQSDLTDFLQKVGVESYETQKSLKLKTGDISEGIVVLEKQ